MKSKIFETIASYMEGRTIYISAKDDYNSGVVDKVLVNKATRLIYIMANFPYGEKVRIDFTYESFVDFMLAGEFEHAGLGKHIALCTNGYVF